MRYCFSDVGKGFRHTLSRKVDKDRLPASEKNAVLLGLLFRKFEKADGVLGLWETLRFIRQRQGAIGIRTGDVMLKLNFAGSETAKRFDDLCRTEDATVESLESLTETRQRVRIEGSHIYVDLRLPQDTAGRQR